MGGQVKKPTNEEVRELVRKEYRDRAAKQLELCELDMRAAELREDLKKYKMVAMMKRHGITEYALRTTLGQRW